MAEQWAGVGSAVEPGPGAVAGHGAGGEPLLSFELMAAVGHANRLREAGAAGAEHAGELVAALEEASAAVAGMATAMPGGLISGPALAECASLLARRARDGGAETDRIAENMARAAGLLVTVDEEVARHVPDAG